MTINNNLPDLLVRLDQAHSSGQSWDSIASRAGISVPALRRIRAGESTPRSGTIRALEQAIAPPANVLTAQTATGQALVLQLKTPLPAADLERIARTLQAALDAYASL